MTGIPRHPESPRAVVALLASLCAVGLLVAGSYRWPSDGSAGGPSPAIMASSAPEPAIAGSWEIAGRPGGSRLTLNGDGTWTAFDGCNPLRGNWLVLDEGLFAASSTPAPRSDCVAVAYGEMLAATSRVEVTDSLLVLSDTARRRRWTLIRDPATR